MYFLVQEVDLCSMHTKGKSLFQSGHIQVQTVALDGAAAVLSSADAVDVGAVLHHNEHPGAVGNHRGVNRNCTDADSSTGSGDHITAGIGMGVGSGLHLHGAGIGQNLAGGQNDLSVLDEDAIGCGGIGAGAMDEGMQLLIMGTAGVSIFVTDNEIRWKNY